MYSPPRVAVVLALASLLVALARPRDAAAQVAPASSPQPAPAAPLANGALMPAGVAVRPAATTPEDPAVRGARVTAALTVPRAIVAPAFGALFGALLGVPGAVIGLFAGCTAAVVNDMSTGAECLLGPVAGLYAGLLVGIPLGQIIGGAIFAGRGNYGAALLGTLVGMVVSVPVALGVGFGALASTGHAEGALLGLAGGLAALPLLGAMIGYELSSAAAVRRVLSERRVAARTRVTPAVLPVFERGSLVGGQLALSFATF